MLVEAAKRLAAIAPDVAFLFIGSGARKGWLEDAVKRAGLTNVTMLADRPRSDQQNFLTACDVAVMAFVRGMSGVGVPSRLYNILAVGKPVIAAVDRDAEPALTIREHDLGWVVPPEDAGALVAAILEARADPARLAAMGCRARATAERPYSIERAMSAYCALIDGLADAG
jgi:glycosyltransferase involved in cell wall biosynthesis